MANKNPSFFSEIRKVKKRDFCYQFQEMGAAVTL